MCASLVSPGSGDKNIPIIPMYESMGEHLLELFERLVHHQGVRNRLASFVTDLVGAETAIERGEARIRYSVCASLVSPASGLKNIPIIPMKKSMGEHLLELLESRVGLEGVSNCLASFRTDPVVGKAAID